MDTVTLNHAKTPWDLAAERAPVEAREQFYIWQEEMIAAGVPAAVANVLGYELFLEVDEDTETAPPAPRDPLLLSDEEWDLLEPYLPNPKTGPKPDYRFMVDSFLRRALRKKKWKDCGGGRVRMQVRALARKGTWVRLMEALETLPLSHRRSEELRRLCQAALLTTVRRASRS
jgi:transposase